LLTSLRFPSAPPHSSVERRLHRFRESASRGPELPLRVGFAISIPRRTVTHEAGRAAGVETLECPQWRNVAWRGTRRQAMSASLGDRLFRTARCESSERPEMADSRGSLCSPKAGFGRIRLLPRRAAYGLSCELTQPAMTGHPGLRYIAVARPT
jgi:hypothetical protein